MARLQSFHYVTSGKQHTNWCNLPPPPPPLPHSTQTPNGP